MTADRLLHYAVRVHATAIVRGLFMCINCEVTPHTFPHILHVDTSPHPPPRILHVPLHLHFTRNIRSFPAHFTTSKIRTCAPRHFYLSPHVKHTMQTTACRKRWMSRCGCRTCKFGEMLLRIYVNANYGK